MIQHRESSPEVWHATDPIIRVDREDIRLLTARAGRLPRLRARLCMHEDSDAPLHEMLIVHSKGCYVRPHKHLNKSESFHIVEGEVDVVLLNEAAEIKEVIRMGDYRSGRSYYYRLNQPLYHTLLIRSPQVIFHEVTNGPFQRNDTVFLPGTPEVDNEAEARRYMTILEDKIDEFCNT